MLSNESQIMTKPVQVNNEYFNNVNCVSVPTTVPRLVTTHAVDHVLSVYAYKRESMSRKRSSMMQAAAVAIAIAISL